ncbi:MAG: SIR2 family NAD-dependent protein deacylase [Campylobacterales bacterium]
MPKVVIFSGAGLSAQSGLSTFRDSGGLWERYKIEDICSAGCLDWNYEETIKFYDKRRMQLASVSPNIAHTKIAELKNRHPKDIAVITQNVDDLFERAGCKDVMHLHGFLPQIRCMSCGEIENIGYEELPLERLCGGCKGRLRPDIVFFGEPAPAYAQGFALMDSCELLVVIGTSGNVINSDMFIRGGNKRAILNNLEPSEIIDERLYEKCLYKPATEAIDEIVDEVEGLLV